MIKVLSVLFEIKQTRPCNLDPYFYIVKLGGEGLNRSKQEGFVLASTHKYCGYLLEPPLGTNNLSFEQNKKKNHYSHYANFSVMTRLFP